MDKTSVFNSSSELRDVLNAERQLGKSIGFVPTMGALHQGHLALVDRALNECDCVVVSIFVNPTQFNNPTDLEKYPRMLDEDISLLNSVGQVLVFAPEYSEVYPEGEQFMGIDLNGLDEVLEGKFRPGHFQGVVHVVRNLFRIVQPDKAYFGLKDFQQVAIIKHMVRTLNLPVEIIECATTRDDNGLALSSRNMRLSEQEKEEALIIPKTLYIARDAVSGHTPDQARQIALDHFSSGALELEYLEIVDGETLKPLLHEWSSNAVCCIAAYCGPVRLIDNLRLV
ncbi:MAG: pantoate--beta-alanine ligase [Bacteroidota bacterium]